ncbi:MAG: hypothetical protein KGH63_03515 [Candidatus Micrarchaeota archaeon]|nr:hypothetical protein [Candidatus Micrarchaeota archaeon]
MRKALFVILLLLAAVSLAGATVTLATQINIQDYEPLAQAALSNPQLHQLLGDQQRVILFNVAGQTAYVVVQGTNIVSSGATSPGGTPDFTVFASRDTVLSILNAPDRAATLKCMLSKNYVVISASNFANQAAIRAAISSGVAGSCNFGEGSTFTFEGRTGTVSGYHSVFAGTLPGDNFAHVFNSNGGLIGFLPPHASLFSNPPSKTGLFFAHPPGILAQNPGLIYDTCSASPNCIGPQNIFQKNPGLIGPNQILAQNPGLIGPADMAIINNNLHGPAEFAYAMGIGAYSNSARALQSKGLSPFNQLSNTNRWGHNP